MADVEHFSDWLYNTPVSQFIQNAGWIIPTVQSIHILAIAVLVGSAIVLDLKLAGVVARSESAAVVCRRYMPWLWSGLGVLLATGLVMVTGEPDRTMMNTIFWTKMALVVVAFVLTLLMRRPMLRADAAGRLEWVAAKPLGLAAAAIWVAIIFCGRWIAYAT